MLQSWRLTILFSVVGITAGGDCLAADPTSDRPPRFALLVGVGKYQNLGASEQLDGSRNDVEAMRELLLSARFGFQPDDIVTLVDESATGAAIRKGLSDLSQRIRELPPNSRPAQILVHYSGHGSQVADQPEGDPLCDESDGLDETIVPYDADKQGGLQDLRDDELFAFAEEVCTGGRNRLWMVLDCCHSGTGARGATKVRKLDRGLAASIPTLGGRKINERRLAAGAVVLSACRAQEVEPEYQQGKERFGLLTRFVLQVLNESPTLSTLSYELLRDEIVARYRVDPSVAQPPLPQLEGSGSLLRDTVLGCGVDADRKPYWEVMASGADRSVAILKAGAFHGITVGSQFELYDQPAKVVVKPAGTEQENGSTAWLAVKAVEGATATVDVFRWENGRRAEALLPAGFKGGFAVERHHEHGAFGLRLRVTRAKSANEDGPALGPGSPDLPPSILETLTTANRPDESPWLQWTTDDEACDYLLRIDGNVAALFPATGRPKLAVDASSPSERSEVPASLRGGWGPFLLEAPEAAGPALQQALRQICRARNLIRLAGAQRTTGPAGPITIELVAVDVDDSGAIVKTRPWPLEEGGLVVRKGGRYAYRIANPQASQKPWFITVLAVDADQGIDQVLPYQEAAGGEVSGEQRLDPGQSRITDAFECDGGFGDRVTIVLATREPNSYYMLSQPNLPKTRGEDNLESKGAVLDTLLLEQTYFKTRGDKRMRPRRLYDESWTASTVSFRASP
ncbi:caspase family protein [Singulisphaera sp. Ch08]|uniref:Caspase family protein n=1 Tax=Singulisphaera sp. Ch08 TaxID=3120278 RepID=A0AAU7C9N3_9BACT